MFITAYLIQEMLQITLKAQIYAQFLRKVKNRKCNLEVILNKSKIMILRNGG